MMARWHIIQKKRWCSLPRAHRQTGEYDNALTCGQWPTPGRSTFSALGYSFCILSALCGLIHGSSAPHSSSTGCKAGASQHPAVLRYQIIAACHHSEHSLSAGILSEDGDLTKHLVKLVEKDIDWRALPSDDPIEDLCSIAVLCRPDYGVDELIIQILVVNVHLLKHLHSSPTLIFAAIEGSLTSSLTSWRVRGHRELWPAQSCTG